MISNVIEIEVRYTADHRAFKQRQLVTENLLMEQARYDRYCTSSYSHMRIKFVFSNARVQCG